MFKNTKITRILRAVLIVAWISMFVFDGGCTEEQNEGPMDFGLLDHQVVIEVVKGLKEPTIFPARADEFKFKLGLSQKRGGLASRERFLYILRPFGGGLSYSSAFKTSLIGWAEEVEAKELGVYLEGNKVGSWGTIEGKEIESLSPNELIRVLGLLENPNLYSWNRETGLVWKVNPLDPTFF